MQPVWQVGLRGWVLEWRRRVVRGMRPEGRLRFLKDGSVTFNLQPAIKLLTFNLHPQFAA
jgi:hypothetical protein